MTGDEARDDASAFLGPLIAAATETVHWPDNLSFTVQTFLTEQTPPAHLLTSARGLVLRGDEVLVVTDRSPSTHILPGGRIEAGEMPRSTVIREVGEESGWRVAVGRQIGVLHFRHLQARPEGYAHVYPDFFQVVFVARALAYDEDARESGGWESESHFIRIEDALTLDLRACEHVLLKAARSARIDDPGT